MERYPVSNIFATSTGLGPLTRNGSCSKSFRLGIMLASGITSKSSFFKERNVSGLSIRWNVPQVSVLPMVSLPADIMMTPSSDMRLTDFSSDGNLLDKISSKMVRGCRSFLLLPLNSIGLLSDWNVSCSCNVFNASFLVS